MTPANDGHDSRLLLLRPESGAAGDRPVAMPLTEAQKELWLGVQFGPEASCSLNLPYRIELRGPLDIGALKEALQWLVNRHETLRMSFDLKEPISYLHSRTLAELSVRSIAVDDAIQIDELARMEASIPFEIDQEPLFRAQLLSFDKNNHTLLLTIHHLICDGFSTRTLLNEFSQAYSSYSVGQAPTAASAPRYTDYVRQQRDFEDGPEGRTAEAHYLSVFSTLPEDLILPVDGKRSGVISFRCGEIRTCINADTVAGLRRFSQSNGCSFFTALLTGLYLLLGRVSGQDDIVVGVPVVAQPLLGFDSVIGHCVNMHPLRVHIDGSKTSSEFVRQVQSAVLDMQEHGLYTFGALLPKLKLPRRADRSPLFAVQFQLPAGSEGLQLRRPGCLC